jgi:hypothetical protein
MTMLLVGATNPSGCTPLWLALIGGQLPQPLTVHVVNDAYGPVEVSLITSSVTQAAETTEQPAESSGDTVLEKGAQYDTTLPCLTLPEVLAVKATLSEANVSATSQILRSGRDYECGSEVTFTVRQAARVGIVVGAAVK